MLSELFRKISKSIAHWMGKPWTFIMAMLAIVVWAATGPIFNFSDTWQLVINTSTTIVTFLMVFVIQNTQNRDTESIHLKIDELIRANHKARNAMINLEDLSDLELAKLHEDFRDLKEHYAERADKVAQHKKKRRK